LNLTIKLNIYQQQKSQQRVMENQPGAEQTNQIIGAREYFTGVNKHVNI